MTPVGNPGQVKLSAGKSLVNTGDLLPDVHLKSTNDTVVSLRDIAAKHHLVLYFYPGDLEGLRYPELTGCTPQACSFRDSVAELRSKGAEVFGISLQPTARQKDFHQREHLTFPLLSDSELELTNALGIPLWTSESGEVFVSRTTVISRKGGAVFHVFDDVQVDGHISQVLDMVATLNAGGNEG